MDKHWVDDFRRRLERFSASCPSKDGELPVLIKLRPVSGCFGGCCSPSVYALIRKQKDSYKSQRIVIEEHETGPEILAFVSLAIVGISLTKELIALTTAILNARTQGRHKGDRSSGPVKVIVRTIRQDGNYSEEEVIEVDCHDAVTEIEIEEALTSATCKVLDRKTQPTMNPKKGFKKSSGRSVPVTKPANKGK